MATIKYLLKRLGDEVSAHSLLNHPFYQAWGKGEVPMTALREYAVGYQSYISAFPAFWLETLKDPRTVAFVGDIRQVVADERRHADLWSRFVKGIGARERGNDHPVVRNLVDTYRGLCANSLAGTLGALFAFESQASAVAHTKHNGLVTHYGVSDADALAYFREHFAEDETHLKVQTRLLGLLRPEELPACIGAARTAAQALYASLDAFLPPP
jgi:pyrroloquinoline-quinone synthase